MDLSRFIRGMQGIFVTWIMCDHWDSSAFETAMGERYAVNTYYLINTFCMAEALAYYTAQGRVNWLTWFWNKALAIFPIYYIALLLGLPCYIGLRVRNCTVKEDYEAGGWAWYVEDAAWFWTCEQAWSAYMCFSRANATGEAARPHARTLHHPIAGLKAPRACQGSNPQPMVGTGLLSDSGGGTLSPSRSLLRLGHVERLALLRHHVGHHLAGPPLVLVRLRALPPRQLHRAGHLRDDRALDAPTDLLGLRPLHGPEGQSPLSRVPKRGGSINGG